MFIKRFWSLLSRTFSAWSSHEAPRLGASIAFYSILSLGPLLILAVAIAGLFFSNSGAREQIVAQVQGLVGNQGAAAVRALLANEQHRATGSFVGVIVLLFGASGVFGELRAALNRMWDVREKPGDGIWAMVRRRLFAFCMALAVGLLLLASLVLAAVLPDLGELFGGTLPSPELMNLLVSILGSGVVFALIFKYVPDAQIGWKDVCLGAFATAIFFTVGKYLIGLYLRKAGVGSAYGAAVSLVVLIVWIYYSAMILLFGAEFTHVLEHGHDTA